MKYFPEKERERRAEIVQELSRADPRVRGRIIFRAAIHYATGATIEEVYKLFPEADLVKLGHMKEAVDKALKNHGFAIHQEEDA